MSDFTVNTKTICSEYEQVHVDEKWLLKCQSFQLKSEEGSNKNCSLCFPSQTDLSVCYYTYSAYSGGVISAEEARDASSLRIARVVCW